MQEKFQYKSSHIATLGPKSSSLNLDEAQGIVECFVAGIGNKDSVGDIVAAGAFTKSLQRRKPRVVWGHNWNDPIGKVLEIYEVQSSDPRLPMKMKVAGIGGLFAKVQFNLNSEKGREAFANVAFFGEEQEWSIGYKTLRAQFDQKSQANVIFELELYEVSPVLHGANQLTGTISVKNDMLAEQQTTPAGISVVLPGEQSIDREEIQKQLCNMYGSKIHVVDADAETVTFVKPGEKGGYEKYKCHWIRNGGTFMFGNPQRVFTPQELPQQPQVVISPPSPHIHPAQPQRIVRPQQMPAIPVAIKPNPIGPGTVMVPLPKIEYEGDSPQIDKNNLDKEEAELRDALLKIVKRHGKFNEDGTGVWAGYYPPEKNPVAGIGVKCANCVLYNGGSSCKIISLPVHPEGKCRFAVIPNGVVKGYESDKKAAEKFEDDEREDYLIEMEAKYPGELLLAGLRGAVGRLRKKKRKKKYKDLAEFNEDEIDEKGYCIGIDPEDAFAVKQILDPIFDYYKAETFVDVDGIVIQSGISYDLIEAVDNALENNEIKKKLLVESGVQVKNLGRRIASYGAARLIDRPNLGGRSRRGGKRGFGVPEGDLNPDTRVDKNRNGLLFDGFPGWEQPDPTPYGPGSMYNTDVTPEQRIDSGKIGTEGKPIGGDGAVTDLVKRPEDKPQLRSGPARPTDENFVQPLDEKPKPQKPKSNEQRRIKSGRNLARHGLGREHEQKFGVSRDEKQRREDFDKIVQNWIDSGFNWEQSPRSSSDKKVSENYLRGKEMGRNQARVAWRGTNRGSGKRPEGFNEKNKSSKEYADWFFMYAGHLGNFARALDSKKIKNREEYDKGIKKGISEHFADKLPDTSSWDIDKTKKYNNWLNEFGYETNVSDGRLSSGDLRERTARGGQTKIEGLDGGFDPDNPFGDENMPYDLGFDVYDKIIEEFLGEETPKKFRPKQDEPQAWSDEEIYRRRMSGATLQEVADILGWSRQEVRQAEQRHMYFLRSGKKIERPKRLNKLRKRRKENKEKVKALKEKQKAEKEKEKTERIAKEKEEAERIAQEKLDREENRGRLSSGGNEKLDNAGPVGHVLSQVSPRRAERLSSGANLNEAELEKYYDNMKFQILSSIQEALKNPDLKFDRPWARTDNYARNPTNKRRNVAGRAYEGSGQLILSMKGFTQKYPVAKWAGAKQWKEIGGRIRKGEAPTWILAPTIKNGRRTGEFHMTAVYNIAQVEGLPQAMYKAMPDVISEEQRVQNVQNIINEIGPVVEEGNFGGAFFNNTRDTIFMPKFGQFDSAVDYYATLMHEITHWTGHESRLRRKKGKMTAPEFSDEFRQYAFEELIAEIGSSLIMGMLGITHKFRQDHGTYLKEWASQLSTDPTAIRRAMVEAQKAVNYVLNRSATLRRLGGFEPDERRSEGDLKYEIPLIEGMVDSPSVPRGGVIRGTFEQIDDDDSRLSSGKIEDFATRPHKAGKTHKIGTRGWSAIDRQNGDREVYHYSTMMGIIRGNEYFEISKGWDSTSDKQGINKILKALGQKEPRRAAELEITNRLNSGKIEDFANRPHVPSRRIKAGSGGAWSSFDLANGDREIYHYSTKMGFIRNGAFYQESDGWGSVSDKQGINKILRALGQKNAIRVQQIANLNTDDDDRFVSLPKKDENGKVIDATGRLSSGGGIINSVKNPKDKDKQIKRTEDVSFQLAHQLPNEPTQQQKDIIETAMMAITGKLRPYKNKQGRMVYPVISVQAAAGTGKTTTLKWLARTLDDLFNLEIGNEAERKEKLSFLSQRFDVDFSKMTDEQIKKTVESLKDKYGSKSLYYAVFNVKNQEEAEAVFPQNTGVATLDKLARWGVMMGAANEKFGDHIARKLTAAGARVDRARDFDDQGKPIGGAVTTLKNDGTPYQFTYVDYATGERKQTGPHPTAKLPDGSPAGQKPTLEHTGLITLETTDDFLRFLKLQPDSTNLPGSDRLPDLDGMTLAEIIRHAVERWTLSTDEKLSAKHFSYDEEDILSRQSGYNQRVATGQATLDVGYEQKLDEVGDPVFDDEGKPVMVRAKEAIGSTDFNPRFWVRVQEDPEANIPEEWLKMGQKVVENILQEFYVDEKGKKQKTLVLPSQGQIAKIFALSNPDLSEAKYMVGHAKGVTRRDAVRTSAKVGDVVDKDGNVIKDVRKLPPDFPLWIVTAIDGAGAIEKPQKGGKTPSVESSKRTATIRRVFADPLRKLNALFIDEAQDLNPTFMSVLENNRDKFPIILVGDERQSVYNFRNAVNAMELMDPDYILPLNESFRFGNRLAHQANILQAYLNLDDEELAATRGELPPRRQWVTGHHHMLVAKQFDDAIELLKKSDSLDKRDKTTLLRILSALDKEFKLSQEFTEKTKSPEYVLITDEGISAKDKIKFLEKRKASAVEESEGRIHNRFAYVLDENGQRIPELDSDGQPQRDKDHNIVYRRVGPLLPKIGETFAFLAGTNEELIQKAFEYAQLLNNEVQMETLAWIIRNPGKTPPPGLVPQITIAPKKFDDILTFLKHYAWVLDSAKGRAGKKPPKSPFIGNLWTREQIKREALRPGKTQLRTMWRILHPRNGQPMHPRRLIHLMEGGMRRTGVLGPDGRETLVFEPAVILPERKVLKIETQFHFLHAKKEKGELSIEELKNQPTTKLSNRADVTDTSLNKVTVLAGKGKGDSAQQSDIHWHLEMEQQDSSGKWKVIDGTWDHNSKKPGRWTGRVILTGQGLSGSKLRGGGQGKRRPAGYYQEDVKRITTRDPRFKKYFVYEESMGVIRRAAAAGQGETTSRNDQYAIDIKDVDGSEERLSEIIREVSQEILKAANTNGADATITTAQLFKGLEAHTIVIGEAFQNAFDEEREAFKRVGKKSPQMREMLNTVYVALTRAEKQIDIGERIAKLYFNRDSRRRAIDHINDEIAKLRKSGKPEDLTLADALEIPQNHFYGIDDDDPRRPGLPTPTSRSDDDDTRVNEEADNAEIEVDNAELEEDENIVPNKDNDDDDGEPTVDEDNIAGKDDEQNEDETSYVNSGRVSSGRENNIVAVLGNRPRRGVLSREAQKIWDTNFPEQLNKIIKNNNKNDVLSLYSDTTKSEISKIYRGKNRSSTFSENPDLGLDPDHEETEFDFFNVNQKDFEKANKLINRVGKVSNVVWALKNSNDKNSSPKTQLAAKKILNDARYDRLSSGRADRRVIKSLDDVKQNMKYDHSRAADYKMTDEQINISDAVMTGDNIVVRALAGTGKTSTLLSTAKRLLDQEPDKRIVYLTFTRKMAEEARKKFKDYPNVEVRTWDSVGFGIIGTNEKLARKTNSQNPGIIGVGNNEDVANHYGFQDDFEQIQVKNKQGDLVPETVGLTRRQRAALMARAATEFSTGKNQKTNRPYTEMNKSLIGIAASKMGINRLSDRQIEELVRQAQKFWNDSFDENSPLEMSRSYILKKWSLTNPDLGTGAGMKKNVDGNDIIFFDEAQDANPVMTDVIRNQKIQWIAVGDSNQAIYEFRGAVDELEDLEAPYQLTLTKTFRFGKEIQAIANRFLKAHETKLTNEEDETPIFAKLRIDAAGPEGIILDSEEMFPKGIAVSATRETKKNGSKETLAFLSQTNAKSFERIINEQDNGRKTGSTTTFKNDLTGMIDHMEWLQGGKKTEKPKNVFPPLWSVKNWDELAKAAGPLGEGGATELGGGAPEESVENVDVSQQALTAYRLFAKYNFNWSKMRQHVANIQTLDGGDVISRKITAADLLDEFEPVEIVDGGVLSASWNPRTKQIVLKNEGGDWGQFTAYKDLLIKGKYKFTWGDPAGKYGRKTEQPGWHLEVPNVDAAASTLNNLAKDIEIGIPGGDSPEFSSLQTFSPIVEGSGSIPNYLSGAKYIDDKRNTKTVNSEITLRFKRADGKFVAVADGNTFQVKNVLKGQDPKTKKSTFAWSSKDKPQFGEPNKWVTSADTIEELYEKLENLRKVNNLSGGSSFLLQPTPLQGAAKNSVDIVAQTAHRSKGLEFDNVILAGDFKAPKWEELAEELIVKMQKDGRVISKEDIGSLKEFLELLTPKEREEFKKKIIKSMGAEEIRLQYVAATRAMRRLVPGSLSWIFDVTDNEDEEFKKVDISKPKTPTRRAERRNRNTQEGDDRVSSGRDRDESEIDPDYPIATEEERRQNEYEMGLDNEVDERIREGDKKSRRQIEKEINQRDVDAGDEQAKVKQRQIIDRDKRLQSSEIDPDYPIATEEERRQNEYEMGLDNEVDERIREGDKKSRRQIEKEINQRDVDAGDEQAKVKQRQIIDRDKRLQSGADQTTEEGRLARRNRKNNNIDDSGDGRISSGRDTVSARIVEKMHGFSADNDENESARRAWERIKEKGWLIDPSGVTGEGIDKKKIESTSIGMANIGSRIAARNRKIKIGDISKNNPDSANQETWMLPVEKLKKMIRIPTKWDPETGDVIERRELSSAELGTMLNLTISESRKLNSPNAGLSFNDVMYLIAEIGNEPRFDSWRLFSPTTLDESGVSESDYMQRAIDNLGRAKLRERFVLETFGKDAFPMYIGRNEKNRISQSEYEKMDSDKRFEYGGIFKDDGSSEDANTELMYEGMRSDSPIPFTQNINKTNTTTPISPVSSNAKTMRAEFRLSELLAALGISGEETIAEKDKKLNSFLSRSSIGEQSRKTIGRWEAMGVPTSVISEMIKSGIIKDAASVFKNTDVGRRLDMELSRPKYSVYEALLNFIKETQGSSPKNTRKTVSDILDATDAYNYLPQIAKAKGSMPYSANVGDIPRYSDSELQQIVNRFNNIFGTQHTIDDIFSDEQIRQARERIEKDGIHTPIGKPNVRTKLKNENNE